MNSIKENAPQGATHYRQYSFATRYLKCDGDFWQYFYKGVWNNIDDREGVLNCISLGIIKPL